MERQGSHLAAVLFADVVGYSDLTSRDEGRAFRLIQIFQDTSRSAVSRFGGTVIKFLGDGMMAEFASSRAAVGAAASLMESFGERAAERDPAPPPLRVGIHVGDVTRSGGDLFGDGVNIAARLESMAEPGEILVSGDVFRQLRPRREIEFEPRGEQDLKGVGRFETYAATLAAPLVPMERGGEESSSALSDDAKSQDRSPSRRWIGAVVALAFLAVLVLGWQLLRDRGGGHGPGRSIAVLPFETLGESANPTFTEGIHGDILTRLSGLSGLVVISRASVMRYRDSPEPPPEISRELGVAWLLQGEVQQVGSQVQVNARLIDGPKDNQVWAEGYQRELTAANLFDIQREVTLRITSALETELTGQERRSLQRAPTGDLEAYRLYARGRGALDSRTEEAMRQAVEYFQDAIERDPEYALAWAGLADALALLESYGYPQPSGATDPEATAQRALELEPELAEAHASLGLLAHNKRDNATAVERLEQAVDLRPSYAEAHNWLSWVLLVTGRPREALESARRAVELDPLGPEPASNLALSHLANGSLREGVRESRRTLDLAPEFSTAAFYEALGFYHQGRFAEAGAVLEDLRVVWAGAGAPASLALSQIALGDSARARRTLARIDADTHPFSEAMVRAALGDRQVLERVVRSTSDWELWPTLAVRYFFPEILGPLREDPRYPEVLRRLDESWGAREAR